MSYTMTIAKWIPASNKDAFKLLTEGSQPSPPIAIFDPTMKKIEFYSVDYSSALFSVFINANVDVDLSIQEKVSGLSDPMTV
jgi:hypothetical protein